MKKMTTINDIFEVHYGTNLELNALKRDADGINFVSRTAGNNGVSAKVARVSGLEPTPAGVLTVAGGGSVLATFLQPEPFYSGRDLYFLVPRITLSDQQKLYYCCCIRANRYRYNYGRQANRTLRAISVPAVDAIPNWVNEFEFTQFDGIGASAQTNAISLPDTSKWKKFKLDAIFELKKGKRIVKAKLQSGEIPFITAIDSNNGRREFFSGPAIFDGNTITVNYNGNGVAEAFYQPVPYWACDDVNVLCPKFALNAKKAMFIATVIRREKYRFNYGRKWHLERMRESTIKLPITRTGEPDWQLMEDFISGLPFTSGIH